MASADSDMMNVDNASNSGDEAVGSESATSSGPPPRLMISKMVLENFKSYAGEREIGPFHKCFSSVVGPNGSGKSNVIDAMLFVFGKRAKKLRLNKVSELIHSSDAFKDDPLPYARVSVHFHEIVDTGDADEDYDVVAGSEIEVTRIARRDNSSSYKLDGKNCAFKDVAKYLDSKGIDLNNNRFLILQGEVEMISMMPPKGKTEDDDGLLEYLEDIIGSNKFLDDTKEASAKVEALSEQRQEKLNRVKAVEKEKEGLEGAKLEAEALLSKEREIRRKQNVLYQINMMAANADAEKAAEQKKEVDVKLEEERVQIGGADERVAEIESGIAAQTAEYDKIHAELKKTKEEFAAYERKDIQLKEDVKAEKAKVKKLEAKVKAEKKREDEATAKATEAEESIPTLEEKLVECQEAKAEEDAKLEDIFEQVKGKTDQLRVELEEKAQELAPVKQERAVYQNALDEATTEVKLMEDSTTRAREQLEVSEKELASLSDTQQKKRDDLAACEDELAESKQRVVDAEEEEKALAETEKTLAAKNSALMARAEEAKAARQASSGRSQAVAGILEAAKKGGELSKVGILGRLGDLATVNEEYDVAVSTACGMLDHIVVQTSAGAQRCLTFLRKHDLGRANFVALDKTKKGAHDRAVETPEGAPRLFDLISPRHPAVTPAIYLGVGNTLVAPDLDTATRWAFEFGKRWRVVTVDGKLIEGSGTMSGGGKSVRRGGMRLKNGKGGSSSQAVAMDVNAEELDSKELEVEAKKALQDLQECRSKRRALVEEIRTLKRRIKSLTVKLPKLTMEIEGCDTTREELTKRIPELREQCTVSKEDKKKLKELKTKAEKCKSDMASCAMLASKLEAEVAKLQKSILDAGGPKLKKQQDACKKALDLQNKTGKELSSAKVTITSSQKAAKKAQKAAETAQKDLEKSKETMENKMAERKELEQGAEAVFMAYENVKMVEAEKRAELESVSKESEELKQMQSKLKCVEVELVAQLDNFEKLARDCDRRVQHWDDEIAKLHEADENDDAYDFSDDEGDDEAEDKDESSSAAATAKDDGEESKEGSDSDDAMEEDNEEDENNSTGGKSKESNSSSGRQSLPALPKGALEQYDTEDLKRDITTLEKERDSIAKNANMGAIEDYRKKEVDYLSKVADLDEITEHRNEARRKHEELRRLRLEMFMDGFGKISLKLKEMYQMITLGGDAELELVDSLDPFSEGIVFSVRPPKKSWKNIANLSGGEKTLSSLALVFALHHYKPTPLYVMDEIDAALDFKNVSIVANYIKERTKNAQFIIISLRNNMFELADRLVGIYKTNNCTKSVTIDPKAFGKDGGRSSRPKGLVDATNKTASISSSSAQGAGSKVQMNTSTATAGAAEEQVA